MGRSLFLLVPMSFLVLCSCSGANVRTGSFLAFDTLVSYTLYDASEETEGEIQSRLLDYSGLFDNYGPYGGTNNLYTLNKSSSPLTLPSGLVKALKEALDMSERTSGWFNPFIGSLSNEWKEALADNHVLDETTIAGELEKMGSSSLSFDGDTATRSGEAELDLGAFAKGYALKDIQSYLEEEGITSYIINGGSSSIILGNKKSSDGLYNVGIKDVDNAYLKLKDCGVGVSSVYERGVTIEGKTYSHIVDPFTGSTLNKHDLVMVVGPDPMVLDVLSTVMMLLDLDSIKSYESLFSIKAVVYDGSSFTYVNPGLEVLYH